jgi:probable rRNA maturation factor
MPVVLHDCGSWALTQREIRAMWEAVRRARYWPDDNITVKCIGRKEIGKLNSVYRQANKPTNILTFSYGDGSHDLAICEEVIRNEARQLGKGVRPYVARIIVHGMLHATGMDHEKSREDAALMTRTEKNILREVGILF